ncbi:hypothetical protein KAU32_08765 [bacterium]|nr:hypothetical protein [bacterium]
MKGRILFLIVLFLASFAFAQDYDLSIPISTEDEIADLYESGDIDQEQYIMLWELYSNPIEVNSAPKSELLRLPKVTLEIADEIIKNRPFKDDKPLKRILGRTDFSFVEGFMRIIPPVKIKKVKGKKVLKRKTDLNFKFRDEVSSTTKSEETPYVQFKYRFRLGKVLDIGILQERRYATYSFEEYDGPVTYDENGEIFLQPGEVIVDPKKTVWPLPKVFINWNTKNFQLITGNYMAGFGLGVVFNESDNKNLYGFKGDRSSDVTSDFNLNLLGAGMRTVLGPAEIFIFASQIQDKLYQYSHLLVSSADFSADESAYSESDFDEDTIALSIPNYVNKTIFGGHMRIGGEDNFIGMTVYHNKEIYASDLYKPNNYSEGMFDAWVWGLNMRWTPFKKSAIQAEFGQLESGAHGFLLKMTMKKKTARINFIYRDFHREFENPYSYTFATYESPAELSAQNERGIKFDALLKLGKLEITPKADIWRYYSTLQTNFDGSIKFQYPITPLVDMAVTQRYKDNDVARNLNDSYITDYSESDKSTRTYVTFNYNLSEKLRLTGIYRFNTYMEHSLPQRKANASYQLKANWKPALGNFLFSFKSTDNNIYRKSDSSTSEEYREWSVDYSRKLWWKNLKLKIGYKRRYYIQDNSARADNTVPQRAFKFYLDWRS